MQGLSHPPITQANSPRGSPLLSPRKSLSPEKTQNPFNKLNTSVDRISTIPSFNSYLEYKVSVQDVISSNKKTADDWGVEGYSLPKFNANLDKPISFKMSIGKPTDFISQITK